jgi:hypothetical protein
VEGDEMIGGDEGKCGRDEERICNYLGFPKELLVMRRTMRGERRRGVAWG